MSAVALASCAPEGGGATTEPIVGWPTLDSTVESEVQRAVADAACYCENLYIGPSLDHASEPATMTAQLPLSGNIASSDPRLRAYATAYTAGAARSRCWTLQASPHGYLPPRRDLDGSDNVIQVPQEVTAERTFNGCAGSSPLDGFCGADFQYCMANELALMLESASAPVPEVARAAVREEALDRMSRAAATYTSLLRTCEVTPTDARCARIADSDYEVTARTRMLDAVSRTTELAPALVRDAISHSESISPGDFTREEYADAIWGPESARAGLFRVFYGNVPVVGAPMAPTVTATVATRLDPDHWAPPATSFAGVPSLMPDASPNLLIRSFRERTNVVLTTALDVEQGLRIPAGTAVDVWLVHLDQSPGQATRAGYLTFDRPVLGVLSTAAALNGSDGSFAASGVTYPMGNTERGVDTGDAVYVYRDRIYALLAAPTGIDQVRVLTRSVLSDQPHVVAAPHRGELAYATGHGGDASARQAIELLIAHEVELPHMTCIDPVTRTLRSREWWGTSGGVTVGEAYGEQVYDALAIAVATDAEPSDLPPPMGDEESSVRAEQRRLDGRRMLRSGHELAPTDVGAALDLLADAEVGAPGMFALVPAFTDASGCGASRVSRGRPFTTSFLEVQSELGRGNVLAPTSGMTFALATGTPNVGGSAGILQAARRDLIAMTSLVTATDRDLALRALDGAIGATTTAWSLTQTGSTAACSMAAYQCTGSWTLTERRGQQLPRGVPVLVPSESDVACLVTGRDVYGDPTSCASVTADSSRYREAALTGSDVGGCRGSVVGSTDYCQRTYSFDGMRSATPQDRAFVLWCARPTGATGCASYTAIDVLRLGEASSTHTFGGSLQRELAQALIPDPSNPVQPLFNSLGMRNDLVPPLENELSEDGDSLEDSWSYYAGRARQAQVEATAQLEEMRDLELRLRVADRRFGLDLESAALEQQSTVTELCGTGESSGDASCSLPRGEANLGELRLVPEPGPEPDPQQGDWGDCEEVLVDLPDTFDREWREAGSDHTEQGEVVKYFIQYAVDCTRWQVLTAARDVTLHEVPQAVIDDMSAGGTGEYAPYGGAVRQELIALHRSLRGLRDALDDFNAQAQDLQLALSNAASRIGDIDGGGWFSRLTCQIKAAVTWIASVVAVGVAVGALVTATGPVGAIAAVVALANAMHQVSNFEDSMNSCDEGDHRAAEIARDALRGAIQGMANMTSFLERATDLLSVAAAADGRLDNIENRAALAAARRDLAERYAGANLEQDPMWRATVSVQRGRAHRALLRAQRRAFIARRAIEFRLAVDMDAMHTAEFDVDAPSSWVNDVFTLHAATDAVSDSGTVQHVAIPGEAIEDYVRNLEDFVHGYPFLRPFAEGHDMQIINLAEAIQPVDSTGAPVGEPQPVLSGMQFECGNGQVLLAGHPTAGQPDSDFDPANPPEPCAGELGGVVRAFLTLSVPARLEGYWADRLAEGNYNYRIERVALNLVARAPLGCDRAARPTECWGDGNVEYTMWHDSDVALESWEGEEHWFRMDAGVIEHARALADERWLTNPLSSSDRALVADFERAEWWGRPLAGTYTVMIWGRPEMQWRNLENVQLLIRYGYWTRGRPPEGTFFDAPVATAD